MIEEFEKLISDSRFSDESLQSQKAELETKLQEFSNNNDFSSDEYIETSQELTKIDGLIAMISEFRYELDNLKQAYTLTSDEEMAELVQDEITELEASLQKKSRDLQALLLAPLRNDDKKAILEFRPGVGGVEASLFAEQLYRMYTRYCNEQGMKLENINLDYASEGGIKEAVFIIQSPGSFGLLRFEGGVHRVQRVPTTESAGRIHTSTASLAIMPFFDKKNIQIKDDDIRVDVFRAGGPGGQSVNTTDSAVRITHIPTGIVISCQNGKSQHKNKDMALSILASRLQELEDKKNEAEENAIRSNLLQDGDRSAKIRTYNFPQSRVTDHRIKKSWFNIAEIMDGNIEDIVKTVNWEIRNSG